MASLTHDKRNNRWLIQFVAPSGSRHSVSLKETRGRDRGHSKASAMKNSLEELITNAKSGTAMGTHLLRWAGSLPEKTHAQLVKAGLMERRYAPELACLGPFLEKWFSDRDGTKQSTVLTWRNVERNLKEFFGADKRLQHITQDDAENFQRSLAKDLAAATVRKRIAIAKQMMNSARKARLIAENPFSELKTGSLANRKRQYFVTHEETRKLLDACSNAEWRTLIALARYGGLRIPSEIRQLKWEDINWANDCIHVHAPKTEHHADDGERIIPLFPEIQRELTELWEHPDAHPEYVLPNIRLTTNVGPTLARIIKRAGLKQWPKPWQNLRASRATELENEFGAHKATEWCGHTERIAEAHYWMVTANDISKASAFVSDAGNSDARDSDGRIKDGEKEQTSDAHMMQQGAETLRNASQDDSAESHMSNEKTAFAENDEDLLCGANAPTGARGT